MFNSTMIQFRIHDNIMCGILFSSIFSNENPDRENVISACIYRFSN